MQISIFCDHCFLSVLLAGSVVYYAPDSSAGSLVKTACLPVPCLLLKSSVIDWLPQNTNSKPHAGIPTNQLSENKLDQVTMAALTL